MALNQEQKCISVGTNKGYMIYSSEMLRMMQQFDKAGVSIIEMLYSSNLVAIVGTIEDSPVFSSKRLTLWNTNSYAAICEISFPSKVQSVKINKF